MPSIDVPLTVLKTVGLKNTLKLTWDRLKDGFHGTVQRISCHSYPAFVAVLVIYAIPVALMRGLWLHFKDIATEAWEELVERFPTKADWKDMALKVRLERERKRSKTNQET